MHCLGKLKQLFQVDATYFQDYTVFMDRIIDNYAEIVPPAEIHGTPGQEWYLPHHGVYHAKRPSKMRVVFDASAQYQGTSLNGNLLSGPDLTNSLIGVLVRFHRERIAIACDIQHVFFQFRVIPQHWNYLRFLW